jgi:hypothetical protein
MELKYIIIICVVVLAAAYFLRPSIDLYKKKPTLEKLAFYGSPSCGWCSKQKTELEGLDVPYIDCIENKELCKEKGISAYPTFILPDGTQLKGFQTKDKIEAIINAPVGK